MKVVHPPELSLTRQAMPIAGQMRLILTMALCFPLHDGAHSVQKSGQKEIVAADMLWQAALSSFAPEDILDLGIPKGGAEWLMTGMACAPQGQEVHGLPVDVHVGALQRQFLVTGPCESDGISIPKPRPFSTMPLGWRNTYGGPASEENPLGIGMEKHPEYGHITMPTVMSNNRPTQAACPGPRSCAVMPQGNLGTFDIQWLRTRWPGPPDDFDWSYYNLAQQEQRQATPFVGNEYVRISNMHPDHALLHGFLPEKRLRIFINSGTDEAPVWHEMTAQADTVWLFPNAKLGGVFWRAAFVVDDERATNMCTIAVSVEDMNTQPRPAAECIATASDSLLVENVEIPPPLQSEKPLNPPVAPTESHAFAPPVLPPLAPTVPLMAPAAASMVDGLAPPTPASAPEPAPTPAAPDTPVDDFDMDAEIRENVAIANEELAKHGLPPITEADVRAQLEKQQSMLDDAQKMMDEPMPSFEEVMEKAGFTPEQADNMMQAVDLPMPSTDMFLTEEAYEKGIEIYVQKFTELTGAPESVQKQLLQGIRLAEDFSTTSWQPANGPKTMIEKLGLEELKNVKGMELLDTLDMPSSDTDGMSPASMEKIFTAVGMSPTEAKNLIKAIDLPMPDDASTESLKAYMAEFEKAAGMPAGSMVNSVDKQVMNVRLGLYMFTDIPAELQALAAEQPTPDKGLMKLGQDLTLSPESKSIPTLPGNGKLDLSEMAQSYGVTSVPLLALIAKLDPLPNKALPKPALPKPPPLPERAPEPAPPPPPKQMTEPETLVQKPEPVFVPTTGAEVLLALRKGQDLSTNDLSDFDFSGLDCTGCDFSGLMLDRAMFMGANVTQCLFIDTQLSGANFTQAQLSGANFTSANMTGCRLHHIQASAVNLQNADLYASQWEQTTIQDIAATQSSFNAARLHNCTLQGNFTATSWNESALTSIAFPGSDFTEANFERTTLDQCLFQGRANTVTIHECHVTNVTLQGTSMQGARLYHSVFENVDMAGGDLRESSWLCMQTRGLTLDKALLSDATFEECTMPALQSARVSARGCRFLACDLRKAHMPRLDLFSGALRSCKLDEANLAGASLYGADMDGADITTRTNMLDTDINATCLVRGT